MKILYGIQATGNGHISRARIMVRELKALGHDIHVLFSGRDPSELWEMEIFEPYKIYRGLTFCVEKGKINNLKTVWNLCLPQLFRDVKSINNEGFDCVISDFEPITSRLAKRWNLPCLGIGHQYAFKYKIPKVTFAFHQKCIMNLFAPVTIPIGLHWHHFGQPVFPPIVPEIEPAEQSNGDYLVYLPFDKWEDNLPLLQELKPYRFAYFCDVAGISSKENVTLYPYCRNGFLDKLRKCEGVISTAGFELASESFHLGKKLLARPIKGQYEQESNGLAVNQLGWGTSIRTWGREPIKRFLDSPVPPRRIYPNVARILAEWITRGDFSNLEALSSTTWKSVLGDSNATFHSEPVVQNVQETGGELYLG